MNIEVTFKAFEVPLGNGPLDIRIVVPKSEYIVLAEDKGCYYIAPIAGLTQHAALDDRASNNPTT